MVRLEVPVRVPAGLEVAASREDLNEPHAAFDEAPRRQSLAPEVRGRLFVDTVEPPRRRRLLGDVDCFGGMSLHPERELVGVDPRGELAVGGVALEMFLVEVVEELEPRGLSLRL